MSRFERKKERKSAMPPVNLVVLEEEMKEDALMFQKYVTKLSQKQKKVEETRVAEEAARGKLRKRKMMSAKMRDDIDKYMEIEKNFKERRAYKHGDGVSKRLTLLRKLAAKGSVK